MKNNNKTQQCFIDCRKNILFLTSEETKDETISYITNEQKSSQEGSLRVVKLNDESQLPENVFHNTDIVIAYHPPREMQDTIINYAVNNGVDFYIFYARVPENARDNYIQTFGDDYNDNCAAIADRIKSYIWEELLGLDSERKDIYPNFRCEYDIYRGNLYIIGKNIQQIIKENPKVKKRTPLI